ncbi:hypothetical protein MN608_06798 [Microdochium nivale]|nr:hypothetical protein MN608_06798 [Microdochium nivale]
MPRLRQSKASVQSDAENDQSDHDQTSQKEDNESISRALQKIDKLKKARAQNHAGITEDYETAIDLWKDEVTSQFTRQARHMETHHSAILQRLKAAVEKKLACEEAILTKIKSLAEDQAHFAMLIDAVYTGRRDLARSAIAAALPQDDQATTTTSATAKKNRVVAF